MPSLLASRYLYGPDSNGQAAIVTLSPEEVSACPVTIPTLPIPDLDCTSMTMIEGSLVICGGKRTGYTSKFCFRLVDGSVWEDFPTLPQTRSCAVSSWINNGTQWWIAGGEEPESSSDYYRGTSVIYDVASKTWLQGPEMPWKFRGSCLVTLDEAQDKFMLLSGYYTLAVIGDRYNHNVYIYENGKWTEQEGESNYSYKRYPSSQTCNRLKNGNVLLTGGKPDGDHNEVWDAKYGFWSEYQDDLASPVWVWYPSSALDEEGNMFVVGGEAPYNSELSGQVLKFDGEAWTIFNNVLPFPMSYTSITPLNENDSIKCD